jgi:hypothetical protein
LHYANSFRGSLPREKSDPVSKKKAKVIFPAIDIGTVGRNLSGKGGDTISF